MTPPAELFIGRTVHERRAPFLHRFNYRIASLMIDLERLDDAHGLSRLFSIDRFNLYSFFQKDHGQRDGSSLAVWARAQFGAQGICADQARLRLLCAPRVLNYVFNPLSIYFAERRSDDQLLGVIYQVHNTFGDSHAYVAPCAGGPVETQEADKIFYVSPFFDVAGRYEFTLRQPGERFRLSIHKQREDGPDFLATMAMKRADLTSAALMQLFLSQPFSTLKTITAIHFEAARLWFKGARYHKRPIPPTEPSSGRLLERAKFGEH